MDRRDFLKIVGFTSLAGSTGALSSILSGCQTLPSKKYLSATNMDDVILAEGLSYSRILSWGDSINTSELYGDNNDFISILKMRSTKMPSTIHDYFFWINHEFPIPFLTHGVAKAKDKLKEHVDAERKNVGGSLLHFTKVNSKWIFQKNSKHNKRWSANTKIPFAWPEPIMNSSFAIGTFANCSGGQTSWGTFLTCEENYEDYYGDVFYENGIRNHVKKSEYGWERFYDSPPEHYGWVVEIDPVKKTSHKLVALGRFGHEGAKFTTASNGLNVVYMGDDKNDECIYKFISDKPGSLKTGKLYVANTQIGKWELLSLENPNLQPHFKTQTDILVRARDAAKLAGGTEQDRPEDIEILLDGTILIALTNNTPKNRPHGRILAIEEKNKDPLSLEFRSYTWLECGPQAGISCPDNFTLDTKGNLWMTSDISGSVIETGPYKGRGNNGLFMIPTEGKDKGTVYQIASAPNEAEFTGPCFSDDGETLFVCVQHPGEKSKKIPYTSNWPHGDNKKPLSSMIAVHGIQNII